MSTRVLISGGASGLGRELALAWAARGAQVAIGDIHRERLEATHVELGTSHKAIPLNVTSDADWSKAIAALQKDWGGLDIVVNNAGIASGGPLESEDIASWQRVIDINLLGVVRGCQAARPLLRSSCGHILNVASMAGLIHPPMMGSYNAVKAAVVAYSETLRFELESEGIGVHVLCPSFFKTNLAESIDEQNPAMKSVLNRIFERSSISAGDVAKAAISGVENGTFLIHSHPEGRQAHLIKRFFPASLYPKMMRKQSAGMLRAWKRDD